MHFEATLNEFQHRFQEQGAFPLLRGQRIRKIVAEHHVPRSCAGVYVVFAVGTATEVIYIGKAGTLQNDGTWKDQMLPGRLCNRQGQISRCEFFQKMLVETGARELQVRWFVTELTAADGVILPILAESQLLQAFYDDNHRLPRYNDALEVGRSRPACGVSSRWSMVRLCS